MLFYRDVCFGGGVFSLQFRVTSDLYGQPELISLLVSLLTALPTLPHPPRLDSRAVLPNASFSDHGNVLTCAAQHRNH